MRNPFGPIPRAQAASDPAVDLARAATRIPQALQLSEKKARKEEPDGDGARVAERRRRAAASPGDVQLAGKRSRSMRSWTG